MAKGGAQWQDRLNALGTALSGYGSALSGNPMYLQNSLLLRQAQQQQAAQEQQAREKQVGDIAMRSLATGGSAMSDANKMGMLRLGAPQAFQSAMAQQAISQLGLSQPNYVNVDGVGLVQTNAQDGPKTVIQAGQPQRAASFITLGKPGQPSKTFNAADPAQLAEIGKLTGSGWTEVKTPSTNVSVNTAENKGQIAMTTGAVDEYNAAKAAYRTASRRGQMLDMFEAGTKYFTPGALANERIAAGRALSAIGLKVDGIPQGQLMQSIQKRIELANTPKGEGTITENERALVREANNILGSDPAGSALLIKATRQLDNYDMAVFRAYQESARANNGVPDPLDVEDRIAKLGQPLDPSIMDELAAAGRQRAPLPAQPGSAQAATGPNFDSLPIGSVIEDQSGQWELTSQGWRPKK